MLDLILLSTALIGSALAGIWDLKTTEIPDVIPYVMIAVGITVHLMKSVSSLSYIPILYSCVVGISFLAFGFLMYYGGQWGGGDAKLLSAIGFLLPTHPSTTFPFPISFLINLLFIGAVYMILYAIVLAFIDKKVITKFIDDVKASSKLLILSSVGIGSAATLTALILSRTVLNLWFPLSCTLAALSLFLLFKFVKAVEEVAFKKRVHVSELKVGDVLASSRIWEGITEEELNKIRRSGKKYVEIKEGVRFAPAFTLALIFTLLYGDTILLLIQLT